MAREQEIKDLRLYYYESGGLRKTTIHKFINEEEVEKQIKLWHTKNRFKNTQLVLIEYTGAYQSKIIKVI